MPRIRSIVEVTAAQAHPAPVVAPEPWNEAAEIAALMAQIDALWARIDAVVDARTDEMKLVCENQPWVSIRMDITRQVACRCSILRRFATEADEAKAREAAAAQALAEAAEAEAEKARVAAEPEKTTA